MTATAQPVDWADVEPDLVGEEAPPAVVQSERSLLAAMMRSPAAVEAVADLLVPADLYLPAHQVIYTAVQIMAAAEEPVDPITVRVWIDTQMGDVQAIGGHEAGAAYLLKLWSLGGEIPVSPQHARYHAELVRDRGLARGLDEFYARARQRLRASDGTVQQIIGDTVAEFDRAVAHAADSVDPLAGQMTASAFIGEGQRVQRKVVIPGLAHEWDRIVVTGLEGKGKSKLLRQIAVCAAAGVHPFTHSPIDPVRVLIIDLENPTDMLQDDLAEMIELAEHYRGWDPGNLRVWSSPGPPLDLRDPGARFRLAANIRAAAPQVVFIGPVKKLYRETGETDDHSMVTEAMDELRARFGFALFLEAHQPAGNIRRPDRPAGSAIWMSWPESGIVLKPGSKGDPDGALKVATFRGHRRPDAVWPDMVTRRGYRGGWPWEARYNQGTSLDL